MIYYSITGEVSSKKNENKFNRVTGRVFKSERFRSWHSSAMLQIARQRKPLQPIEDPVKVSVVFAHGDNRRRDGDNGLSAIMDLLVDAKVLADDCWKIVKEISVLNTIAPKQPKTEIYIERI